MSKFLAGLNPEQKRAVMHKSGPLLILAGAGSGKTRVVVNRICHLLERKVCAPRNILAITFTNKAAGEMKTRLEKPLGIRARDMTVCTSHSLGNRILREFSEQAGLPKNFKIVPEQDRLALIKSKLREVTARNESVDLWWLASRISLAKNRGQSPADYPEDAEKSALVRKTWERYEKALGKMAGLDFDDLLQRPLHLLQTDGSVLRKLRERFTHLSVDEYQDTNRIQFELIRLIANPCNNLCAVGDDDQGIYGWRGADIGNILSFQKSFPGTAIIKLERNYRSTSTILSAANAVISHNKNRTPKSMWSDNGDGAPIDHYMGEDEQDEAEWLAKTVEELFRDKVCTYRHIAVLTRTHELTRIYEEEFRRRRIPCKVAGGHGFYDRKEVKDLLGYLFFIANPLDEMSLMRILRVPSWHIGKDTMKALEEKAGRKQWPLWEAFKACESLDVIKPQKEHVAAFTAFINRFMGLFSKGGLSEPFRKMVVELKYREHIAILCHERKEEIERRLAVVDELEHSLELFEKRNRKPDLARYLQELFMMLSEKEEDEPLRDAVSLLTLHASKGMEFPVVFLPGLDDNVMPSKRSVEEGNLEEERRLFYVGMTRAQKRLYFSWPSTRFLYNKPRAVNVCRFVSDIPQELLAAPLGKREAETREKVFSDFFSEMRAKFAQDAPAEPQNLSR